ncbi:MAG: carboxymuconolactone decarboxylase family protein [Acidobacteriota bacterium]|uniref:carboxymuconolactone decarboxylase family protein n=1 Tax=Fundidesulfovibrio putealis TaxID=270496 RepID=UPI00041043AD|nr:carboxymuconolactone decarboxylase family protein [Fundidesulfovibrio putealis]
MTRDEIHKEMVAMLGLVPSMFETIPDSSLELEWNLYKQVQFAPGAIPNKYRELIGVAISAISKCRYCAFYHTELAKLNGATQAEIEEAVHYAKSSAGWSAYLNGMQVDFEKFKGEIRKACDHVRQGSVDPGDMSE